MEILFLGTGTGIPGNGRRPTSVAIREGSETLLIDVGPGTITTFGNEGFSLADLRAVILTHFHLDHCSDLGALLFAMKHGLPQRTRPLHLWGPSGLRVWLDRLRALFGSQIDVPFDLHVHEVTPPSRAILGPFQCQFWKTQHTDHSLGVIVEVEGRKVIYTSDTEFSEAWVQQLPQHPEVLITECSLPFRVPGHMIPEEAGQVAQRIHAQSLYLVHLYPLLSPAEAVRRARKTYQGPIEVPTDGFRLLVP